MVETPSITGNNNGQNDQKLDEVELAEMHHQQLEQNPYDENASNSNSSNFEEDEDFPNQHSQRGDATRYEPRSIGGSIGDEVDNSVGGLNSVNENIPPTFRRNGMRSRNRTASHLNNFIPGRDKPRVLIIERLHCLFSIPIVAQFLVVAVIALIIGIIFAPNSYRNLRAKEEVFADSQFVPYMQGGYEFQDFVYGLDPLNQQLIATVTLYKREMWKNITVTTSNLRYKATLIGNPGIGSAGVVLNTHPELIHRNYLSCPQGQLACTPIVVSFVQPVIYPGYTLKVQILNGDELKVNVSSSHYHNTTHDDWNFADSEIVYLLDSHVVIKWRSFDPEATIWELGWRYCLLVTSIPFTIFYFAFLFAVSDLSKWTMEQWWVGFFLILLNLYNNPLLAFEVLGGFDFLTLFNQIFVSLFISYMLLAVLVLLHGSFKSVKNRSYIFFYGPKILLVGVLYIVVFFFLMFLKFKSSLDPTFSAYDDTTGSSSIFYFFGVFLGVAIVVYILTLIYYIIRGLETWRAGVFVNARRNRFWLLFIVTSAVVIATLIDLIALLFRPSQDKSSVLFLMFFLIYNMYGIIMGFFHLPTFTEKTQAAALLEDKRIDDNEDAFAHIEADEAVDLFDNENIILGDYETDADDTDNAVNANNVDNQV